MSDPFKNSNAKSNFVSEVGLVLSAGFVLLVAVLIWGFYKFSRPTNGIPEHVLKAPVAIQVGPEYFQNLKANNPESTISTESNPELAVAVESAETANRSQAPLFTRRTTTTSENESTPFIATAEPAQTKNLEPPVLDRNPVPKARIAPDEQLAKTRESNIERPGQLQDFKVQVAVSPIQKTNDFLPAKRSSAKPLTTPKVAIVQPRNEFPPSSRDLSKDLTQLRKQSPKSENNFAAQSLKTATRPIPAVRLPKEQAKTDFSTKAAPETASEPVSIVSYEQNRPTPKKEQPLAIAKDKPKTKIYRSKPGDSFWSIAQTSYGDGRFFRALYEINRPAVASFNTIPVGTQLEIPSIAELNQRFAKLCPVIGESKTVAEDIFVTRGGETLFEIARNQTGQAFRYLEIMELNKDRLPQDINHLSRLPANIQLKLPILN